MLKGTNASSGIGIGNAVIVEEKELVIKRETVRDAAAEVERFKGALDLTLKKTEELAADLATRVGEKEAEIMQGHMMLLMDPMLTGEIETAITGESICAEYAIEQVCTTYADLFASMDDELMQQRATDMRDIKTHMQRQHKKDAVRNVSFQVHAGEIVCLAGIEGNGQTEFVYGLTGLEKISSGKITLDGKDITNESIRQRSKDGMSHIPEDRHKHGLVLDYSLENNMVLQRYWQPEFQKGGFIRSDKVREYSDKLIAQYDVRSGQGSLTTVRSMSGGNQQKAIIAREIDKDPKLLVAVQPTRGLDVGAIEYIHRQIVAERDKGTAVLLVSLELDEVMNLSDRILVMYEGEVVGEFDPKTTTVQELGLYMAGARKQGKESK